MTAHGIQCPNDGEHRRLMKDVYYGDGKENPPLTARMQIVEDCLDRLAQNMRTLVWVVVGAIVTGAVDIVVHIVTRITEAK